MSELIVVRRQVDPEVQEALVADVRERDDIASEVLEQTIPATGLAAVFLFPPKSCRTVLEDPRSQLGQVSIDESLEFINYGLQQDPATSGWMNVNTIRTDSRIMAGRRAITYILSPVELEYQTERVRNVVGDLNGLVPPGVNRLTYGRLYLAFADSKGATASELTAAFEAVRPPAIRFMPAEALPASEAITPDVSSTIA